MQTRLPEGKLDVSRTKRSYSVLYFLCAFCRWTSARIPEARGSLRAAAAGLVLLFCHARWLIRV